MWFRGYMIMSASGSPDGGISARRISRFAEGSWRCIVSFDRSTFFNAVAGNSLAQLQLNIIT
jgi:hypothetical protein